MYVLKPVEVPFQDKPDQYEIGAIVNGVWFVDSVMENHDDARQMVNYLNGGRKTPDILKSRYCFIVIQEDMPPRMIGPVALRETRDDLARKAMLECKGAKFFAVTWHRDYLPEIRVLSRDELDIRKRTYLGKCYCIEGHAEYSDHFLFKCEPDDADEAYVKALEARYKGYIPDSRQDDTWINEQYESTVEANGYILVPITHEFVLKEYIK